MLQATLGYLQVTNSFTTYVRNPIGQVTSASTLDVTYNYTFDAAHRVTSVNDSRGNKTIDYSYSAAGRRLMMQDSNGNRTDYNYDPTGRLTYIWAPNNDTVTFAHDEGGRLKEKWLPNGVNTQYTYNADNTLQQLVNRHGSGSIISQHDYSYDELGNRRTHSENIAGAITPYKYVYDELNRLTEVRNDSNNALIESYSYGAVGNRISSQSSAFGGPTVYYNHDAANQLTDIRSGSSSGPLVAGFVYDENGNLTKKCEGGTVTASTTTCTGSTITDLAHDFLNRPVQIAKTGISTQTYKYDDSGRRIQKVAGSAITNYLYDGAQIASQYTDAWTNPTFNYTYGPGTDAPTIRAGGAVSQYYHQNGIGNVVAVTNQAGVTEGTASYNPYGIVTTTVGSIPTYGFTGREPDETGFVYFRARYYDSTIGRFIQRDPIRLSGGLNQYVYVGNNPTAFVDPLGTEQIRIEITNFIRPSELPVPGAGFFVRGDNRGFDANSDAFRTRQIVVIETDPKIAGSDPIVTAWTEIGASYTRTSSSENWKLTGYSDATTMFRGYFDSQGNAIVQVGLEAPIPEKVYGFIPAPAIDQSFFIKAQSGTSNFAIAGHIDGFPSTEINARYENGNISSVYQYDPNYRNPFSPFSLLPGVSDQIFGRQCSNNGCVGVDIGGAALIPSSGSQTMMGISPKGS